MGGVLGGGGKGYAPPGPPLPTPMILIGKKKKVFVCVGGGWKVLCGRGGEVLETKLFFRRGGSGSAAKGGLTEKVGIPYL